MPTPPAVPDEHDQFIGGPLGTLVCEVHKGNLMVQVEYSDGRNSETASVYLSNADTTRFLRWLQSKVSIPVVGTAGD